MSSIFSMGKPKRSAHFVQGKNKAVDFLSQSDNFFPVGSRDSARKILIRHDSLIVFKELCYGTNGFRATPTKFLRNKHFPAFLTETPLFDFLFLKTFPPSFFLFFFVPLELLNCRQHREIEKIYNNRKVVYVSSLVDLIILIFNKWI